jgi:hypothetical protein
MKKEYWRSTYSLSLLNMMVKYDLTQLNKLLYDAGHKA